MINDETADISDIRTLSEVLFLKGFTHKSAKSGPAGQRNVRLAANPSVVVFTGDAAECWRWIEDGCEYELPSDQDGGPDDYPILGSTTVDEPDDRDDDADE